MATELECKFRIDSHDELRRRLQSAGAVFAGRVVETNRLFDKPDASLRNAGCGLRIRDVRVLYGEGVTPTLTFKGPVQSGAFKRREEIELPIADASAMGQLLTALGFVETIAFEKRRESWKMGACSVELDELPRLGFFVEIEGPDESSIKQARQILKFENTALEEKTYVAMVAELMGQAGGLVKLRFGA